MAKVTKSFQYGSQKVILETGEIARQASGAVLVNGRKVASFADPITRADAIGGRFSVIRKGKKKYAVIRHE